MSEYTAWHMHHLFFLTVIGAASFGVAKTLGSQSNELNSESKLVRASVEKNYVDSSQQGVNETLVELAEGIEQRDMTAIKDCFSSNSSFYSSLINNAQRLLSAYRDIHIVFDVADTRLHDAGKRMTLVASESLEATTRESKQRVSKRYFSIFEFVKNSNHEWQIHSWSKETDMRIQDL